MILLRSMKHEISTTELLYLHAYGTRRFCPWCLQRLAHAKYPLLLESQALSVHGAKFAEESGPCSECGREMNVFVSACKNCGQAAPEHDHSILGCSAQSTFFRPLSAEIAAALATQEKLGDEAEPVREPELPPIRIVRGGLPSLGKRR